MQKYIKKYQIYNKNMPKYTKKILLNKHLKYKITFN